MLLVAAGSQLIDPSWSVLWHVLRFRGRVQDNIDLHQWCFLAMAEV